MSCPFLKVGGRTEISFLNFWSLPASQSPNAACPSVTVVPPLCPLGAEALCPCVLMMFLVLCCLWLIGGKETTGLMRDELGQQWAMMQR